MRSFHSRFIQLLSVIYRFLPIWIHVSLLFAVFIAASLHATLFMIIFPDFEFARDCFILNRCSHGVSLRFSPVIINRLFSLGIIRRSLGENLKRDDETRIHA